MSDTLIFYSLSGIGIIAHIWAIIVKRREATVREWMSNKYNQRYLGATVLAVVVFILVGPGDGADLSSTAVRMNAFSFAGLGAEVIRVAILGPKRAADRNAQKQG